MATQPSLITQFAGPQIDAISPFQLAQGALTLGNLRQQQAIGAQNLEGLTQENVIRARQMQDEQDIREAIAAEAQRVAATQPQSAQSGIPAQQIMSRTPPAASQTAPQAQPPAQPGGPLTPGANPAAAVPSDEPYDTATVYPQSAPLSQDVPIGSLGSQTTQPAQAAQSAQGAAPAGPPHNPGLIAPLPGAPAFGVNGFDYTNVVSTLLKKGNYAAAQKISAQKLDWQTKALTNQKDQLDNAAKMIGLVSSIVGTIHDEASKDAGIGQALRAGLMTPQEAQTYLQQPYDANMAAKLQQMAQWSISSKDQVQQLLEDNKYHQSLVEWTAKAPEFIGKGVDAQLGAIGQLFGAVKTPDQAVSAFASMRKIGIDENLVKQAEGAYANGGAPNVAHLGMTEKERADANNSEVELAKTATDPNRTPEERAAASAALNRLDASKRASRPVNTTNITIPGMQPGGANENLTGNDFLAKLPKGLAGQVKAIAEGRATMPNASRSPVAIQLRNAVFQYDPDYSDQRAQVRKSFATDKNIRSLNTAIVHMDQLNDAAKDLNGQDVQAVNRLVNWANTALGNSSVTNFETLKNAVSGEMANALKGQATDVEIANISKQINAANSPQQFAGVVRENAKLLGTKLNTYQEQYQQANPSDKVWSPTLPTAQKVLDKFGVAAKPATQAQATPQAFVRTAVSPGGHTIGQKADGGWYDTQTGKRIQ